MRITDVAQVRRELDIDPGAADLAARIADTGALIRGHFRLQSGAHAPCFLRVGQLALRSENADAIARVESGFVIRSPGLVVLSAETSPRFLAEALCAILGARLVLAAVDAHRRPTPTLRRGELAGAAAVVVVTDVVSTGASIQPLLDLARGHASDVSIVAVAAQRSAPAGAIAGTPCSVLARAKWPIARASERALCRDRIPLLPAFELN